MSNLGSYIDSQEKLVTIKLLKYIFEKFGTLEKMKDYFAHKGVDISIANLSRYINEKALPKTKLKEQILDILVENKQLDLTADKIISKHTKIWTDEFGRTIVNTSHLINDTNTLKSILFLAIRSGVIPRNIDKIVTVEVDGIPIAITLAELLNAKCIFARRNKTLGIENYIEEDIKSIGYDKSETIYLPFDSFSENERILIVNDIIRTGSTIEALVKLVAQSEAQLVQIISLIGIGLNWVNQDNFNSFDIKILKVYSS